jgi:hypothetical protein
MRDEAVTPGSRRYSRRCAWAAQWPRPCENAKTLDYDRRSHLYSAALDAHITCRFSFEIDFQNFILVALRAFVFSHSHCRKWLGTIDCRGDDEWAAVIDPYVAPVSTPIIGVHRVKRIAHVNDSICIRLVPQNHASAELEFGHKRQQCPPHDSCPIQMAQL